CRNADVGRPPGHAQMGPARDRAGLAPSVIHKRARERTAMRRFAFAIAPAGALAFSAATSGAVIPFTETFNAGASDWRNAGGGASAAWMATGGPDNSGYITESTNVNNANTGVVVAMRAAGSFNSSGGAFSGNWIAEGVTAFS